eukprot:m.58391 g.58391  ORF g.58391 m.58391 type:complete len:368 (+) comp11179_c0_seq1:465-1568(+)
MYVTASPVGADPAVAKYDGNRRADVEHTTIRGGLGEHHLLLMTMVPFIFSALRSLICVAYCTTKLIRKLSISLPRLSHRLDILVSLINTIQTLQGPYKRVGVALGPRDTAWDSGAIHGPTIHRLPNKTYALFYMGFEKNWPQAGHPNCTSGGPTWSNNTFGDHSGRRIGVALSDNLNGPWQRLSAPLFGPCKTCWDSLDVSNPAPIFLKNGSIVMLYKGRGKVQAIGLAFAPSIDGPFTRNVSNMPAENIPGEDPWGWVDEDTGIIHTLTHDGNGATSAGGHAWTMDGVHWTEAEMAYTGVIEWSDKPTTTLFRRERPQILLSDPSGTSIGSPRTIFTSAEDCAPKVDAGSECKSYTVLQEMESDAS